MHYRATCWMVIAVSLCLLPGLLSAQEGSDAPAEYAPDATGVDEAPAGEAPGGQAPAAEGEEAGEVPPGADGDQQPGGFDPRFLIVMIGIFVLMYFVMGRSRRKQEAKRKEMLASIKKGDKVTTIGGQIGTIMDVREDEVVLKVDESTNTRIRYARWAIRGVGEEGKTESQDQK